MKFDTTRVRFALAFLREPQRVLTVCLTVMLGALALILADGFIDRTFQMFREDIIRAHYAHLQVLPESDEGRLPGRTNGGEGGGGEGGGGEARSDGKGGADGEGSAGGESGAATDSPALRDIVQQSMSAYPGTVIAARLNFSGLIAHEDRTVGFLGEGVEPANEAGMSKAVVISSGQALDDGVAGQIMLGEGLAASIGARVGDTVTLLANLPGGGVNAIEAVVSGVFHTAVKAYDDRALRLPLSEAQRLMRMEGVSRLMILLPETGQTAAAAERLRLALAGQPVRVKQWSDLADFYNKTVELFSRQLGFVRAVILVIVLLATSNSMARNVLEQQREIGTMMALGARRGAVARKYVGQALVMGGVGGLIGAVLAGIVAAIVTWIGIPMPPPPGTAHGFVGGINFSAANASSAFVSVLVVCFVASLLPALRASRITIVDALRSDR